MESVKISIDKELLQAADGVAKRAKQSRSALVRDAVRAHLRGLEIRASEERERVAYAKHPQSVEESLFWQAQAVLE
jgi:metal-responsive CopG/Arc/MetJ family transcriptional regulator